MKGIVRLAQGGLVLMLGLYLLRGAISAALHGVTPGFLLTLGVGLLVVLPLLLAVGRGYGWLYRAMPLLALIGVVVNIAATLAFSEGVFDSIALIGAVIVALWAALGALFLLPAARQIELNRG